MSGIGRYLESPQFREVKAIGAIGALGSATEIFSKSFNDAGDPEKKYLPFNLIVVTNESGQRYLLTMGDEGGGIQKTIPAGSIIEIETPAIYQWSLKNLSAIANDAPVEVVVEKVLTIRIMLKTIIRSLRRRKVLSEEDIATPLRRTA